MAVQEFTCNTCGLESHVQVAGDEGVYTVIQLIKDEHRKWSPECNGAETDSIKVSVFPQEGKWALGSGIVPNA